MNKRLWLRNGALLSIPLVLGLVLLHLKLVRDHANVPFQNIVIPRSNYNVNSVQSVAFSPDSRRLAIIDTQHPAQIWNIEESRFVRKLERFRAVADESQSGRGLEYLNGNDGLAWRKDNRLINGSSRSFRVFNLTSEKFELEAPTDWKKHSPQYLKNHYSQCAISPQGTLAILGQIRGEISVWNTQTGQRVCAFKVPERETCGVAISADDKNLAVASLVTVTTKNPSNPNSTPTVVAMGIEIALRNVRTGTLQKVMRWDDAGIQRTTGGSLGEMGLAFSPDGKRIAATALFGLSVWNVDTGQLIYTRKDIPWPFENGQKRLEFSPDGAVIAGAGWNKKIYVWAASTGELLQIFNGSDTIESLAFSPNSKLLATGGQYYGREAVVKIWDVANMN